MIPLLLVCALVQLEESYNAGDYGSVVASAPAELARPGLLHSDSVRVLELHGFSLVALGRNEEAMTVFRALLQLEPDLILSPAAVSPKIRAVFDGVRAEAVTRTPPLAVRVDTVYQQRSVSLSVLVPGLRQFQRHSYVKGGVLLGLAAGSLAGLGFSSVRYGQERSEYLAATEPQQIASAYRESNNWYHAATIFAVSTAVSWLASLIDGLLQL